MYWQSESRREMVDGEQCIFARSPIAAATMQRNDDLGSKHVGASHDLVPNLNWLSFPFHSVAVPKVLSQSPGS